MPRGDGTGPQGLGPMTGRGFGYCTGYNSPGFTRIGGRGLARGRGRGIGRGLARGFRGGIRRGFRRMPTRIPVERQYNREYTEEDEIEDLKVYADQLEEELELVEERLDELTE